MTTRSGLPVAFVAQGPKPREMPNEYEPRIYLKGEVQTRVGKKRGAVRDAAAQFDESGVIVTKEAVQAMIGLLQRVKRASVAVNGETVGAIEQGLLVLVGVERGDGEAIANRLLERLLGYRVFPDGEDKMNLSVRDVGGGLLLVPQFIAQSGKALRTGPPRRYA